MSKSFVILFTLFLGSAAIAGTTAFAQEKSKDEELDRFLKKLEGTKSPDDAQKPAGGESTKAKGAASAKAKPGERAGKEGEEVAPKDKELDNFLEKLGETRETPAPDEKPSGLPKPDSTTPNRPGKPGKNELKGESKNLDEHLEELTGRRRKRKNSGDEGSGPLGKIVKEMRDVEQRLGKPDTGEETRKKQTEIVKELDKVIEELRNMSSSQGRRKLQLVIRQRQQRQGQQQPGDQPGNTGGNAPHTKPEKPTNRRSTAMGKEEWGHLPPELRQEMDNIGKEEGLSKRQPLIDRYFDSLSKKTLVRGE